MYVCWLDKTAFEINNVKFFVEKYSEWAKLRSHIKYENYKKVRNDTCWNATMKYSKEEEQKASSKL